MSGSKKRRCCRARLQGIIDFRGKFYSAILDMAIVIFKWTRKKWLAGRARPKELARRVAGRDKLFHWPVATRGDVSLFASRWKFQSIFLRVLGDSISPLIIIRLSFSFAACSCVCTNAVINASMLTRQRQVIYSFAENRCRSFPARNTNRHGNHSVIISHWISNKDRTTPVSICLLLGNSLYLLNQSNTSF